MNAACQMIILEDIHELKSSAQSKTHRSASIAALSGVTTPIAISLTPAESNFSGKMTMFKSNLIENVPWSF